MASISWAAYNGAKWWGEDEINFHDARHMAGKILLMCVKSLLNSNKQLSKLVQVL